MRSGLAQRLSGRARLAGVILAATGLSAGAGPGQAELPPTLNLFGDEIVQKLHDNGRAIRFFGPNGPFERAMGKPGVEGYSHTLTFHDGRQIRGSLAELTKTDVHWKRPDADTLMVFSRDQIRRIALRPSQGRDARHWMTPAAESPTENLKGRPLGTVKLPGGDWLHGEVVGGGEGSFIVTVGDGPEFEVARSSVQWLHFGPKSAPAFGFHGGNLDLESWSTREAGTEVEIKDGVATVSRGGWIGRATTPMQRFEMSFELPPGAEDLTEVWLQPLGPEVNSYTIGTVVLRLGKKEFTHCIYTQQIQDVRTPIPPEDIDEKGATRYRVLYDGLNRKLTVIRNGRQLGEWGFVDEKNVAGPRIDHQFQVNGICLIRRMGAREPLQIRRLQIQPWTGDLQQIPVGGGDCILWSDSEPGVGTLGMLGRTDFYFSGRKRDRVDNSLLQFANDPKSLPEADAVLLFGERGELSVGDLEIRGGKVKCRTVFSSSLSLTSAGLEVISFPAKSLNKSAEFADRLIFKNGDEIGGKFVSANEAAPVKWRMRSGQEIVFGREAIAGVRLAREEPEGDAVLEPIVELRNGDLIRGTITATQDSSVTMHNSVLGQVSVPRASVSLLLPNAGLSGVDGGFQPERWIRQQEVSARRKVLMEPAPSLSRNWVYLDGTYILQMQGRLGWQSVWLSPPVAQDLERFELRCDVTDAGGNDPGFSITVRQKESVAGFQASFVYGRLQIFMHSPKPRGGPNWRHILYEGKLKDSTSRRRVRMFVDSKLGTADIFMDGVLLTRIGKQQSERLPGMGGNIRIQGVGQPDSTLVFSNLWVGPWNGELPTSSTDTGVALTNGDFASGPATTLSDGKVRIESEIGPLDLPVNRIVSVHFGGEQTPARAAARLRLIDGTSLHVESYECRDEKITAKSPVLGELTFNVSALAEIAIDPSPVRPPQNVLAKAEASEPVNDEKADQ